MVQSALCRSCDSSLDIAALDGEQAAALERMQSAVQVLLRGVGEDVFREGLVDTPRRVAKAWLDMASGNGVDSKGAFGNALFNEPLVSAGPDGLVIVRDITFAALSEATLLPFHGRAHIAYVPAGGVVLGLSKLARVTKALAARLQTQRGLTHDLADAVQREVRPLGVAVFLHAAHLGAGPAPQPRVTSAVTGCFAEKAATAAPLLQEVVMLLGAPAGEAVLCGAGSEGAAHEAQPPAACASGDSAMLAAVDTLLEGVGESSSREGLRGSAQRYLGWLHAATAGYSMAPPSGLGAALDGGPRTPDDQSPDPSDASSDDMSTDLPPCFVHPREARGEGAETEVHSPAEQLPAGPAPASPPPALPAAGHVSTAVLRFTSQCEHHLLPFYGTLRLAYAGGSVPPGDAAAALAHIVEMYSRRLQVQERLTQQVADAAAAALGADAVLAVCESAHMCMVARGVEKHASTTITTGARGLWAANAAARAAPLQLLLSQKEGRQS